MKRVIVLLCAAGLLAGCQCNMTGITPSSTPITSQDTYTIIGPVTTYSYGITLLNVIPICEDRPAETCLKRALTESGGDALIEVTMDTTMILIPYFNPYRTRLQGTAIKLERGGAAQ